MNNTTKTGFSSPGLATLGMAILLFVALYDSKESRKEIRSLRSINEEQQSHVTHHKNKYDEEYAKRVAAEASIKEINKAYGGTIKAIEDKLDIQSKQVKAILRASTTTTGSGIGKVDTIYVDRNSSGDIGSSIVVSDTTDWFDISGSISSSGFSYRYVVRDSITLVPYKDGKKTYVKGISANPNTKITGLQGILVAEEGRSKRFGIGPSIQIGYDTQFRVMPGISIQYSLLRF